MSRVAHPPPCGRSELPGTHVREAGGLPSDAQALMFWYSLDARDDVEQRGLAGPRGPHDGRQLAGQVPARHAAQHLLHSCNIKTRTKHQITAAFQKNILKKFLTGFCFLLISELLSCGVLTTTETTRCVSHGEDQGGPRRQCVVKRPYSSRV